MESMAAKGGATLASEEARWVHAAAAGDGGAFAALYARYAQRAFNLAYRTVGSEEDAARIVKDSFANVLRMVPQLDEEEPAFQSHLFAATHTACHELMEMRHHRQPGQTVSTALQQNGAGSQPEMVPSQPDGARSQREATESQGREEVHQASMRLPERQREVLALRELEELSYGEIAAVMEMSRDSVGQLISRARINLSDEMQGTVLASVAAPSPECDRALPLIAARQDGQLDAGSGDTAWLDAHLTECGRCRLAVETTEEAAHSYRTWAPIAATPWLFKETMAKAAEAAGTDWSGQSGAARTQLKSVGGAPPAYLAGPRNGRPRRRLMVAAGLAVLLLLASGAVALVAHNSHETPARPAAATTPQKRGASHKHEAGSGKGGKAHRKGTANTTTRSTEPATLSNSAAAVAAPAGPIEGTTQTPPASHPSTNAGGVKPTRQAATPKATTKPATTPASPTPQAVSTPAPPTATTVETNATEEPGKQHESHGKAVGRPPK
jgi:RNA polymerase sigma-70 factor (ECF subfamily)